MLIEKKNLIHAMQIWLNTIESCLYCEKNQSFDIPHVYMALVIVPSCLMHLSKETLNSLSSRVDAVRRRDEVESWGIYFEGLVNLDLINFLTMWIFTLCEFRPGESWTNAVYISSENVLNTKVDCSKNVLLIVVLVEYKLKWMCC